MGSRVRRQLLHNVLPELLDNAPDTFCKVKGNNNKRKQQQKRQQQMFLIKLLHMPFCAVVVTKDKSMLDKLPSEQTNRLVGRQRGGGEEAERQTDRR